MSIMEEYTSSYPVDDVAVNSKATHKQQLENGFG